MRRLALAAALLLAAPAYADMFQDGRNAKLPEARQNLGAWPTVDAKEDLGCKGDGVADDTACIQAAVAKTGSPNIYFGPGTYMFNCGAYTFAGTPTMIGAGRGATTLKLQPGCTLPAQLFLMQDKTGGGWKDLTIDANNAVAGTALPSKTILNYICQSDGVVEGVGIINMQSNTIGMILQVVGTCISKNWHVRKNYFHLTTPTGATQNLGFAMGGVTPPNDFKDIYVDNNIVVNTAVQVNGTNVHVTDNDISGFGFGTGIYQVQKTSHYHTITGNQLHDSTTGFDVNNTSQGGIELDGDYSIFANNQCANLGGACVVLFGSYNIVSNNISKNVALATPQTINAWGPYRVVSNPGQSVISTGNLIQDNTDIGGASQLYSYYEDDALGVNNIVRNNQFAGGTSGTYLVKSATTKVTPTLNESMDLAPATVTQNTRTFNTTYRPGGVALTTINELLTTPTLGTGAQSLGAIRGVLSQPSLSSAFTGALTQVYGYDFAPVNSSAILPSSVIGYSAGGAGWTGNGVTSGTYTNYGFVASAPTAAAGAGGTLINTGFRSSLGTGSSAGTTNRGIWVTGNGGAASTNYAIYSDSTARSLFSGPMTFTALPASAGAGGLAVCVDSAGVLYKKASCP